MKPTLNITNWPSKQFHGVVTRKKFTIMRRPRRWEHGDGRVEVLTPPSHLFESIRRGIYSARRYRELYLDGLRAASAHQSIAPGSLTADDRHGRSIQVLDGDTLCCACSRVAANRDECHRVWAAEALVEAGWRVILDGEELEL